METQNIIIGLIGSIWLIGGNIVVIKSLQSQGLPLINLFNPFVISKLRGRDWAYLLILVVLTMSLFIIFSSLGFIK